MYSNPGQLEKVIRSTFVPQVLVVTTEGVERICGKSGKYFIDLLRPFSSFPEERKTIKGIREQPYELKGFEVRFITPSELCLSQRLDENKIDRELHFTVKESFQGTQTPKISITNREQAIQFVDDNRKEDLTPWFSQYQSLFLKTLGVSEHEFFNHPVACIFVVSSTQENDEDNLTDKFVRLYDSVIQLPELFTEGFMDPNFFRYHVLLHDNHDDLSRAQAKLSQMKKTFGGNACLLNINSLPVDTPTFVNSIPSFLSDQDWEGLRSFSKDIIFKYVLPHLEQKLQTLEEFVSVNRKTGLGLKVRSILGFTKRKQVGDAGGPEMSSTGVRIYPIRSPTAQARQLADIAFMIRDYDSALVNYKNCIVEMKNDQSMKYWAGAIELAALASFMLDYRKDSDSEMEKAYKTYLECQSFRYATRVTFFENAMKQARGKFSEAASVCVRDGKHSQLLAGLLQEQAAYCYLFKPSSPMFRMFSMRLIIAADKFYEANQLEHAYRCAISALDNYYSRGWGLLDDHVLFLISRSSFLLGDLPTSTEYSCRLLENSNQSPERQSSYFREFLHILTVAAEKGDIMKEVPIPKITKDSIKVFLNSTYSLPEEKTWKLLEDWVVFEKPREKARENFRHFTVGRDRLAVHAFKSSVSALGEVILVEVEIENPLKIPIQLYSCQLICDHFGVDEELSLQGLPPNPLAKNFDDQPPFSVEPIDLLLVPSQTNVVTFELRPLKEGLLEIRGLGFNLAGKVWCRTTFPLQTRKLHSTKQQRSAGLVEVNLSTSIQIVSAMPFLEVTFPTFPKYLYQGEIRKYLITFKNSGIEPMKNLAVKLSHPGFFVFGQSQDPPPPDYQPQEDYNPFKDFTQEFEGMQTSLISSQYDLSIVHLPIEKLNPGESVAVPFWVRGTKPGTHQCKFVFYYEPEDPNKDIKFRVHREEVQFGVVASIRTTYSLNPSLTCPNCYTLGLQVTGLQHQQGFNLLQVSSVSGTWKLEPLSFSPESEELQEIFKMQPQESTMLFFLVSRVVDEKRDPESLTLYHTNVSSKFSKYKLTSASKPWEEFLTRSKRPNPISYHTNFTHLRDQKILPVTSVVDPHALDLLLFWETSQSEFFGMTDINDICFVPNKAQSVQAKSSSNIRQSQSFSSGLRKSSRAGKPQKPSTDEPNRLVRNPIRFVFRSSVEIKHDFSLQPHCIVPLRIIVSNPSLEDNVSFKLETIKPDEQIKQSGETLSNNQKGGSNFFWVGVTKQTVENLQPQADVELIVHVGFYKSGIYDVNKIRFTIYNPEQEISIEPVEVAGKQIVSSFQHLITVLDS